MAVVPARPARDGAGRVGHRGVDRGGTARARGRALGWRAAVARGAREQGVGGAAAAGTAGPASDVDAGVTRLGSGLRPPAVAAAVALRGRIRALPRSCGGSRSGRGWAATAPACSSRRSRHRSSTSSIRSCRRSSSSTAGPSEAASRSSWRCCWRCSRLAVWAGWFSLRAQQGARFGFAWVLAAVLPVASLMPSLTSTMNDRLMYAPSIGFAIALATWLSARGRTSRWCACWRSRCSSRRPSACPARGRPPASGQRASSTRSSRSRVSSRPGRRCWWRRRRTAIEGPTCCATGSTSPCVGNSERAALPSSSSRTTSWTTWPLCRST